MGSNRAFLVKKPVFYVGEFSATTREESYLTGIFSIPQAIIFIIYLQLL